MSRWISPGPFAGHEKTTGMLDPAASPSAREDDFAVFFRDATGFQRPYQWQICAAIEGLPEDSPCSDRLGEDGRRRAGMGLAEASNRPLRRAVAPRLLPSDAQPGSANRTTAWIVLRQARLHKRGLSEGTCASADGRFDRRGMGALARSPLGVGGDARSASLSGAQPRLRNGSLPVAGAFRTAEIRTVTGSSTRCSSWGPVFGQQPNWTGCGASASLD